MKRPKTKLIGHIWAQYSFGSRSAGDHQMELWLEWCEQRAASQSTHQLGGQGRWFCPFFSSTTVNVTQCVTQLAPLTWSHVFIIRISLKRFDTTSELYLNSMCITHNCTIKGFIVGARIIIQNIIINIILAPWPRTLTGTVRFRRSKWLGLDWWGGASEG